MVRLNVWNLYVFLSNISTCYSIYHSLSLFYIIVCINLYYVSLVTMQTIWLQQEERRKNGEEEEKRKKEAGIEPRKLKQYLEEELKKRFYNDHIWKCFNQEFAQQPKKACFKNPCSLLIRDRRVGEKEFAPPRFSNLSNLCPFLLSECRY